MEFKFGSIELSNGEKLPKLGLGCWNFGNIGSPVKTETEAINTALNGGMIMFDTAEQYGEGLSESFLGRTLKSTPREKLFIISKVYPHNAGKKHMFESCKKSLERLQTDYIDLYLLHWRGRIPLRETVECMEELVKRKMIRMWGVSNFDVDDMEELWSIPGGRNCVVNEVLYHLGSRGIEYDLIPWMRKHKVALIAYCPVAQAGDLKRQLFTNKVLNDIAKKHNVSVIQILLRFVLNCDIVAPIPKSANPKHTQENIDAFNLELSEEEWEMIDKEFPAPDCSVPLDVV